MGGRVHNHLLRGLIPPDRNQLWWSSKVRQTNMLQGLAAVPATYAAPAECAHNLVSYAASSLQWRCMTCQCNVRLSLMIQAASAEGPCHICRLVDLVQAASIQG